jgi:hypothetical protein
MEVMTVLRTNTVMLAMLLAACGDDGPGGQLDGGEPCRYEERPLAATDVTPWGTVLAEDIALLEIPQPGTWRWAASAEGLTLQNAGLELAATARFVHDADDLRLREHVGGGDGVACETTTVVIGGTLTFSSDEDGSTIVSVPIRAEQMVTAGEQYAAAPSYEPISNFSDAIEATDTNFETMLILGGINWTDQNQLYADFHYFTQRLDDGGSSGSGIWALVASFEP